MQCFVFVFSTRLMKENFYVWVCTCVSQHRNVRTCVIMRFTYVRKNRIFQYFYVRTRDVFFFLFFFSTQRHSTRKKATFKKNDLRNGKVCVLLSVFFSMAFFEHLEICKRKRHKYENRKKKGPT